MKRIVKSFLYIACAALLALPPIARADGGSAPMASGDATDGGAIETTAGTDMPDAGGSEGIGGTNGARHVDEDNGGAGTSGASNGTRGIQGAADSGEPDAADAPDDDAGARTDAGSDGLDIDGVSKIGESGSTDGSAGARTDAGSDESDIDGVPKIGESGSTDGSAGARTDAGSDESDIDGVPKIGASGSTGGSPDNPSGDRSDASLDPSATAEVAAPSGITARAYALIEQTTGRILGASNADAPLPMASTTKVMTALVVLENAKLDDVVTISRSASGIEGSSIFLEVGETLTVEQLLYGLMLKSGNDAAVALAEHVGGSVSGFVDMMNRKAASMGLTDTHFVNPNGLPADGHYTTALELARIAREAMNIETFRTIVSTKRTTIPWDGHEWDRVLKNGNKLLTRYEPCVGIKTGFTKKAGRCLVSAAQRDGMTIIAVALNAPDMYGDCQSLFEYGFAAYHMEPVVQAGEAIAKLTPPRGEGADVAPMASLSVPLRAGERVERVIALPERVDLPIAEGYPVGDLAFTVDGEEVAHVPLCATRSVRDTSGYWDAFRRIWGEWPMLDAGA